MDREIVMNYPSILFLGDGMLPLIKAISPKIFTNLSSSVGDLALYPLANGKCFKATQGVVETLYCPFDRKVNDTVFTWYFALDTSVDLGERVRILQPRRIVLLDVNPWGNTSLLYPLQKLVESEQENELPSVELQIILLTENLKYGYTDVTDHEHALQTATEFYSQKFAAVQVRQYFLENFNSIAFESFLQKGVGFVKYFLTLQREKLRDNRDRFQQYFPVCQERDFTAYHLELSTINALFRYDQKMSVHGSCTVLERRIAKFLEEKAYSEMRTFLEKHLADIYDEKQALEIISETVNRILHQLQNFYWSDSEWPVRDILDYNAEALRLKRLRLEQEMLSALENMPDKLREHVMEQYAQKLDKIEKLRRNYGG